MMLHSFSEFPTQYQYELQKKKAPAADKNLRETPE
jgi:hypothetical protein